MWPASRRGSERAVSSATRGSSLSGARGGMGQALRVRAEAILFSDYFSKILLIFLRNLFIFLINLLIYLRNLLITSKSGDLLWDLEVNWIKSGNGDFRGYWPYLLPDK